MEVNKGGKRRTDAVDSHFDKKRLCTPGDMAANISLNKMLVVLNNPEYEVKSFQF